MSQEVIHHLADVPKDIDAVFALGKNIGVNSTVEDIRNNPLHLSQDSRITVLAAGMLMDAFPEAALVLSGGATIGRNFKTQPEYAQKYLLNDYRYPSIDPSRIIVDSNGFDTAASAESLRTITEERGYRNPVLLSVGYHLPNSLRLFRNYRTPIVAGVASESILAEKDEHFEQYVADWTTSERIAKEKRRERIRGFILNFDRKGLLVRQLVARNRVES